MSLRYAIPGKELKSISPQRYESRAKTTQAPEGTMLIQEKISGSETLLKLYVAIDDDLKALRPHLQARHLPRDPRGGDSRIKPNYPFTCRRIIGESFRR